MEIKLIKHHLKAGITSLILEYDMGYSVDTNGSIKPKRKFETLSFFLYTHPRTEYERIHNQINLEMAEQAKNIRLLNKKKQPYSFDDENCHIKLTDYMEELIAMRKDSPGNYGNWCGALKHLIKYAGEKTLLNDVDRAFAENFKNYLAKKALTKNGTPLSTSTQNSYFLKFKAVLNRAVEDGLILHSPAASVKSVHMEESGHVYLTFEEMQRLAKTECRYDILKKAFIFSCLTGMRWSDVNKLTWKEVQIYDGSIRIVFRQKKTRNLEYLDITNQALDYMGKRGEPEQRVFEGLKYSTWYNNALRKWCSDAGIDKHVTFHCGRHTFAVLQLSLGTDIYTVSKLLGHRELKTTQIYAKIVDNKKREAVNKIPQL